MRSFLKQALVVVASLLLTALPVHAQDKPAAASISAEQLAKNKTANDECFACHSEQGLKTPHEGVDLNKLKGLLQSPEAFYASDHQRLVCTKCHNDGYDDFPHAADARDSTTTCTDCHSKKADAIQKEFDLSVHARNLSDKFSCTTCHNPHLMRVADKLVDPHKIVAQDNRVCLGCHDSDAQFAKFAPEKKVRPAIDDIHEWLPNTRLHWKAVRCVECHTPAVAAGQMISHQILDKDKAEKNCVTCHSANSMLKARLYRHLVAEEEEKFGFANSIILANTYVLGATRNPLLDTLIIAAFAAMLLGLIAHGVGRIISHIVRRRNKNG